MSQPDSLKALLEQDAQLDRELSTARNRLSAHRHGMLVVVASMADSIVNGVEAAGLELDNMDFYFDELDRLAGHDARYLRGLDAWFRVEGAEPEDDEPDSGVLIVTWTDERDNQFHARFPAWVLDPNAQERLSAWIAERAAVASDKAAEQEAARERAERELFAELQAKFAERP